MRDARSLCSDGGRYIDYGVRLYTVRQDDAGDEVLPGRPRVFAVREPEEFGGIWDTRLMRWHSESANPVVWYCSEEQRPLIVHEQHLPRKLLVRGAEGAGKTRGVVAPWGLLRAIELAGQHVEIGGTAPTNRRLETLRIALFEKAPPDWYTWRQRDGLMRMPLGVDFRLLSTHRSSEAEGSPIQSFDWAAWMGDELQDQLHAFDDIAARGRRAADGVFPQCGSASVKDSAAYRDFEDRLRATGLWAIQPLRGRSNPFVSSAHWDNLRRTLSPREYARRVEAENLPSEQKTYPDFLRKTHSLPVPFTARDVTAHALSIYRSYIRAGAAFHLLCGHDPGEVKNTTTILRAYLFPKNLLVWLVVGELITERTTQERHAAALVKHLRKEFGVEYAADPRDPDSGEAKALVFRDPHGRGEKHPDDDCDQAFRRHGLDIFSPSPEKQLIKRRTRLEMMNRLILSAAGDIRFGVACRDDGTSLAPETLKSFEDQERDDGETAEKTEKGAKDITHPAVATGYALFPFEREEFMDWTLERVLKAVARS